MVLLQGIQMDIAGWQLLLSRDLGVWALKMQEARDGDIYKLPVALFHFYI